MRRWRYVIVKMHFSPAIEAQVSHRAVLNISLKATHSASHSAAPDEDIVFFPSPYSWCHTLNVTEIVHSNNKWLISSQKGHVLARTFK